jgi:uncharacterized membrane protein
VKKKSGTNLVFWVLIVLYSAARVLQVFSGRVPMLVVVALHVFLPVIFALIHGARAYRWRGILTFVAISLVVGNIFENLGVRTGFPYGQYYFTDVMGPKLSVVPIMLGFAYVGMAYLAWTLARLILGQVKGPLIGLRVVNLPLVAAFIMVAWDLSQDPVWATILHCWIWMQGGAYFGVPVSNFFGWYLAAYVIFQLFALCLRGRSSNSEPLSRSYWYQALLFFGVSAAGNLLLVIPRAGLSVVSDPTGRLWRVSDITGTSAMVTVFTMGAFAMIAWMRIIDQKGEGGSA